jgi:hypothetical protein
MEENQEEPINLYQAYKDSMKQAEEDGKLKNETFQKTLHQLKTEKRFQDFFENYHPNSIESFINSYAFGKANWLGAKRDFEFVKTYEGLRFKNEAEACLKEILQKKLFDLQCLWRAEQIKIEGIETTYDFLEWEQDILNCPFLDLITQREIDLYLEYYKEADYEESFFYSGWQNFDDIKADLNASPDDESNTPEWYLFYDNRMGSKGYLLMADIRGEKEKKYVQLGIQETTQKAIENQPPPDPRPFMFSTYDYKQTRKFIAEIDQDKAALEAFDLWVERVSLNNTHEHEEAESAYAYLSETEDVIPIEGNYPDWRFALVEIANAHKKQKILEAIPIVYDEYLFRKQTGIQYEKPEQFFPWQNFKDLILLGRELSGEPRNFDF